MACMIFWVSLDWFLLEVSSIASCHFLGFWYFRMRSSVYLLQLAEIYYDIVYYMCQIVIICNFMVKFTINLQLALHVFPHLKLPVVLTGQK